MKYKKYVSNYLIFMVLICLTKFQFAYSACTEDEWECDNGQCIPDDEKCDGKVNCNDRSDEIAENCIQIYDTCQSYTFKCSYGACVAKTSRCNERQDCADNSDELVCVEPNESALQGRCSADEIQCAKSRECISSNNICDGRRDCSDGSDETLELCIGYGCRGVGFQCGYGACINGNAKCNGSIECADGSDEAWELCNYPRKKNNVITPITIRPITQPITQPATQPTNTMQCQIPNTKQTAELTFKLHPFNDTLEPGSFIEHFETLHVECKNGISLHGQSSLLCENGKFNIAINRFPTCYSYCERSQIQTISTRAICDINKHNASICAEKIRPNTEIKINCAYGFTRSTNNQQFVKCLPNGNFDNPREPCVQECGRVSPSSQTLSKNGITIRPSNAPWHVAIYWDNGIEYQYICSGSIVSSRIIISAAHCFWDKANQSLKNNKFQVIAGKNNRNYITSEDETPQISDVEIIHIPKEYKGSGGKHLYDIAIVILKTPLEYSESCSPICIPNEFRNNALNYVPTGLQGFITAFGLSQLERLQMKTLSYHDCKNRAPDDSPLATDKFCIHNNDSASVCRGDSGGGFVTTTSDSDGNIYNLFGVISYTPYTINDCSTNDGYVAVTSIAYISSDIVNKLLNALEEDKILF